MAHRRVAQASWALRRRERGSAPPRYQFPLLPLVRFGLDLALGRRRSVLHDSQLVMASNPYPRRYQGVEQVPSDGPFLLAANHYARPGLQPYHWAMAITARLAQQRPDLPHIYWVMAGEWRGRRLGPLTIPPFVFRWVFGRVARVHDLVALPVGSDASLKRAATLRRLLGLARQRRAIGLTPEGGGSGVLRASPPGTGLLLAALGSAGLPIVPAGVWEEGEELVISFGAPFHLSVPQGAPRQERDRLALEQVMVAIARLLPEPYRGVYAQAVAAAGGDGV